MRENWMDRVLAALRAGRKIDAIKEYREATGASLIVANDAVEEFAAYTLSTEPAETVPEVFGAEMITKLVLKQGWLPPLDGGVYAYAAGGIGDIHAEVFVGHSDISARPNVIYYKPCALRQLGQHFMNLADHMEGMGDFARD